MKNQHHRQRLAVLYLLPILFSLLSFSSVSAQEQSNQADAPIETTELQTLPDTASSGYKVTEVEIPADLWTRIRRGFAMPDLQVDMVQEREQWYANRPDYIERMTARSSKYLYHIVEEIERRGMPTELALLPFIESAFNPQAVSSARASGMWQFMPRTGKDFDLKQNAFRDDRRDVLASTRAALDYLQRLHGKFGDWHLALAAYNWGEGNVGKAVNRNLRAGQAVGYTDLNMPAETRLYVPKLQAMKNLVANPQDKGIQLPTIPNHPYFQSVPLPRDMDVALVARLAEVPIEDFKALNPSAHRPVLLAGGTSQILLPWDNAEIFERNMATYEGRLASWTVWVAPKNMKVPEAAKKVGMSKEDMSSVNKIPPRMLIKAGSALLAPRPSKQEQDVTSKVADNGQLNLAPEVFLRKQVIKVGKKDTLANFAKRYRIAATDVAKWNRLSLHSTLKPGQKLVLMLPVKPRGKK